MVVEEVICRVGYIGGCDPEIAVRGFFAVFIYIRGCVLGYCHFSSCFDVVTPIRGRAIGWYWLFHRDSSGSIFFADVIDRRLCH